MAFEQIKREVAIGNRVLSYVGLANGVRVSHGHVSMRVPGVPDRFIVKGRGYSVDALPMMKTTDMVVCDLEGNKIDGPPGVTQCYEVKIHSAIYSKYPEVQSVVHVHPTFAVLMSVLGVNLVPMYQVGARLVLNPIPVWPHSRLVSSAEDGEGLANLMEGASVALLIGHGAVAIGTTISESISIMYNLEEQARMNYLAFAAMGRDYPSIPAALVDEALNIPGFWELPHFKSSLPKGTSDNPHWKVGSQFGAYEYWASLVEEGV